MTTLILLRHAKSDWADPGLADHDRPLNPRGERAALVIGRYLVQAGLTPARILCSTARRAADTLALVQTQTCRTVPVERDRGLYLTGAGALLRRLAALEDGCPTVMVVAHNPDLQELALALARDGRDPATRDLAAKFPTAGLVVLDSPAPWAGWGPDCARLALFTHPKLLV